MAVKKKITRAALKPDSTRGEAPGKYSHFTEAVTRLVKAVASELSGESYCAPSGVLAMLEPKTDCSLLSPLEECRAAARALIRQFSEPISVKAASRDLRTFDDDARNWLDSNARAVVRRMAAAPEPLVVLQSKTAIGEDETLSAITQRCSDGRVPLFLSGRTLKKVTVDYADPDVACGGLLPEGMTQEEAFDCMTPEGAYRLWSSLYSCFDDGDSILLFEEPSCLESLMSAKPMMTPCVVMAKTDRGVAHSIDSNAFLFEDESQCYDMQPSASADLDARFLSRKLASSTYWVDRFGCKVTPGVILVMTRSTASWCSLEDYDPKSVIELVTDYCADCSFNGVKTSPKTAREWLLDKYGPHGMAAEALCSPVKFKTAAEIEAESKAQTDAAMKARAMAKSRHPAAGGPPAPPLPPRGKTGEPLFLFRTRDELVKALKSKVIGQDAAIDAVVRPIVRRKAGLADDKKPIASMLLAGPSGVGKTETAKALATACFGSEECLKRIDCSELHDSASVNRLIGSSQGYVGYDDGGDLLNWVYKHKRGVLLLDEIEKANPVIYDSILLPLLDYGVLSGPVRFDTEATAPDGSKRKVKCTQVMDVDCTKLIVIMTSNLGAQSMSAKGMSKLGFGGPVDVESTLEADVQSAIKKEFRTEIRNRFGKIIVYKPLTLTSLERIFELKWGIVDSKAKLHGLDVQLSSGVPRWFVSKAKADNYGARPLDRLIEERLVDPLSDLILDEEESKPARKTPAVGKQSGEASTATRLSALPGSMRAVVCDGPADQPEKQSGGGFTRTVGKRTFVRVAVVDGELNICPVDDGIESLKPKAMEGVDESQ